MLVLGLETSCDETGVALYDSERGLLADALFSQIEQHRVFGGVVPELASRDHVKRMLPLIRRIAERAVEFIRRAPATLRASEPESVERLAQKIESPLAVAR